MISTDVLQVGFLSSLTKGSSLPIVNEELSLMIVNEGSSLTIVNETTNFIKTIVLKRTIFKKRTFKKTIVSFSIFRRRFPNEIIVFQKNENVNIPIT